MEIASVIKYEGDNKTFIWKHPKEDFNKNSQLIVHESQEAIFFMNGQALDTFGPGKYTLDSENLPVIGKVINLATKGESPFHCEVYFINKTVQMSIKWGTGLNPISYIDPEYHVPFSIGASGEMNLQILDDDGGKKLLLKLVGTTNGISWNNTEAGNSTNFTQSLEDSFRPLILNSVKTYLAPAIKNNNINLLEIDEHLGDLSKTLHKAILPGFEEYGLTIPQFYLNNIVLPENDPNFKKIRDLYAVSLQKRTIKAEADIVAARRETELEKETTETELLKREAERKIISAQTEAQMAKIEGFAEAEVMAAKGYNQKDIIEADVKKAFAEGIGNMGSGSSGGSSTISDIAGLGIGIQAAGYMANQTKEIFSNSNSQSNSEEKNKQCSKCGKTIPVSNKFCPECGAPVINEDEIICPVCKKTTKKGKFCSECGSPLTIKCPKCGEEYLVGTKFCNNCGTKLGGE